MPAPLPPTSAYTYAVELSADEAMDAGATSITFSQPLAYYVENFLGFDGGTSVPSGYYDPSKGAWIASTNGVVLTYLSVDPRGHVSVDVNGDGVADTGSALSALGITATELAQIPLLYRPGQSLWRVPITHFTTWDFNWAYGNPGGSGPPPGGGGGGGGVGGDGNGGSGGGDGPGGCQQSGSIIGCQTQSLGQALPVAGTSYQLHYDSNRQRGRQSPLTIPLSGPSLMGAVERIDLEVDIAGRQIKESFAPQPNLSTTFTWDGYDAYGRLLLGGQPVHVKAGNVYNTSTYGNVDAFGLPPNASLTTTPTRAESTVWVNWSATIGGWDERPMGLGGWSLNVHHVYDVGATTIRFGDGTSLTPASLPGVISPVASRLFPEYEYGGGGPAAVGPDGSLYVASNILIKRVSPNGTIQTFAGGSYCGALGDGNPAVQAGFGFVNDLAFGPDGSLYVADAYNNRIRKIDPSPSHIVTTVAGSGPYGLGNPGGMSVDPGPPTQALLNFPTGVDVAPDGTLYIADSGNKRIRSVSPAGTISTVAGVGNGGSGDSGMDGPATQYNFAYGVTKVRVARDGSLYVNDVQYGGNGGLDRIGTDGIIHHFACTGGFGFAGDGGPAIRATCTHPGDIAVGPDGTVFFIDSNSGLVRHVDANGIIQTVAGNTTGGPGVSPATSPPATTASIAPIGIRVGPDGTLYVDEVDWLGKLAAALPGFSSTAGTIQAASSDGRQVFIFDANGRHLQTLDAFTSAVLYNFTYDTAGRLSAVTDVHNDVTQINRDPSGNPVSIVSIPFNLTTKLTTDSNGYLASVTDPASQTTQFTYGTDGLMQSMTDARGLLHQFSYDSAGRLAEDQEPTGGSKTLARTDVDGGFNVSITTALRTQSTYQTTMSSAGTFGRRNTQPSGLQASLSFTPAGTTTVTTPDGTTVTTTETPDPRFGMLSPLESVTTTTPHGLTSTESRTRAVTLSPGGALTSLTETTTDGGAPWTRAYNAAAYTWTTTSPAGRTTVTTIDDAGEPIRTDFPGTTLAPIITAYDGHGQVQSITQGDAGSWIYAYDAGYPVSVTDPMGRTVTTLNDPIGRAVQTTLADNRVIASTYDNDSNLSSETLPDGGVHAFSYDLMNQLASYSPPILDAGTWSTEYSYDIDNRPLLTTHPDGATIQSGYDTAGRLSTLTYPQGVITRTYDPMTGQLASIATPSGETLSYAYDAFLRTGMTWTGPVAGTVSVGFNSSFQLVSRTVDNQAMALGYDLDSLLTSANSLSLARDPKSGLLAGTALGAVTDSYGYDANGRLASYVASSSGTLLYSEVINARDPVGRITQKTDTIGTTSHVWGYTYDAAGRLTDVTEDGAFYSHYGYDSHDNRTTFTNSAGTVDPTYDAQDRLLTYGATSYTYTANGERRLKVDSAGTTVTTYDAFGNLIAAAMPGRWPIISYIIDGENRRVGKKVNGTLTQGFLYQDALNVIAQLDGSGNVVARFVFGSKPNVPDYYVNSSGTFRILSDHLGSPRLIVNVASGRVVEEIDYDEFGNVTNDTSGGLTPFGFAGGLYDRDTGFVRFGARDYDPSVGRWTAKDPVRFAGGMSLYGYVGNDPVNNRDSRGKQLVPSPALPIWMLTGIEGSEFGPLGTAIGLCIGLALTYDNNGHSNEAFEDETDGSGCPPCQGPLPPDTSRHDAGHPHYPCPNGHTHYYTWVWRQDPSTCNCYANRDETVECD
jgi:RHS repeat-associated protein